MILAEEEHRRPDALVHAHQSAARLDAFLGLQDSLEAERTEAASRFGNIAVAHVRMHLYEEAIPYARREVELAESVPSARIPLNVGLIAQAKAVAWASPPKAHHHGKRNTSGELASHGYYFLHIRIGHARPVANSVPRFR